MSPHSDTLSRIFGLSPYCYVLSGEATNTNFMVFGLTRSGLEPTIYHTRDEHAVGVSDDFKYIAYAYRM